MPFIFATFSFSDNHSWNVKKRSMVHQTLLNIIFMISGTSCLFTVPPPHRRYCHSLNIKVCIAHKHFCSWPPILNHSGHSECWHVRKMEAEICWHWYWAIWHYIRRSKQIIKNKRALCKYTSAIQCTPTFFEKIWSNKLI